MSKTSREIVLDILLDIDRNDRFAVDALGGALRANQFMNKKEKLGVQSSDSRLPAIEPGRMDAESA